MITEDQVFEALKTVIDPEIGIDIVNLGFIYDVKIDGDNVAIAMTLTIKGCPMHATLKKQAEEALMQHTAAKSAEVKLVFEPPWNKMMMSDEAKERLGIETDVIRTWCKKSEH
ncbi:metal-sulfur cluster assembly factor [bacterium]|nr:metal-sulfur cluster assembly factor [bacterium]MBU1652194.1 metal-sulfur cluster assembly factor [bacterium]MBU1880428.1 metal-sulfur cluster assembly factor [bacterium]